MNYYAFNPFDTLFFRDGRPFNLGEASLFGVPSQFPPAPPTVVGALRASLARHQSWDGRSPWSPQHIAVLGDGQDLGALRFHGPYLFRNGELLLPAPAHLLGQPALNQEAYWTRLTRLAPGPKRHCDLGVAVRLPVAREPFEGLKEMNGFWLTCQGMATVLAGGLPSTDQVISQDTLWEQETRTGISIDAATRTSAEGQLYASQHIRLIDPDLQLVAGVSGLPEDWAPESMGPLGGESRMAWIEPFDAGEAFLPEYKGHQLHEGTVRYTVTLVTPADLATWPQPGEDLAPLPGRLICACQRRAQQVGGWDTQKRSPVPLKPLLPAGTTWFCEAEATAIEELPTFNGSRIGQRKEFGFGQIIIGTW